MSQLTEKKQKSPEELAILIERLKSDLEDRDTQLKDRDTQLKDRDVQLKEKDQLIHELYKQLKLSRHRQFGRKSEKQSDDDPQAQLFDEAQAPVDKEAQTEEATITVPAHERKQKGKGRKPLPEHLERVRQEYDISEAEKTCDCGCQMTCIGETTSEQLDYVPAKTVVIVHARKKYVCKHCDKSIKTAAMPKQPIPKGIATPGLLSYVCVSKFEDYLPLYRLEKIFSRIGVDLPRASLSNWVIQCADLLKPLYKLLHARIGEYDIASADETRVQVLNEPGREAHQQSYMWLFHGGPPGQEAFLYHYAPSRAHTVPYEFLHEFNGYLHCDGYSGYEALSKKPDKNIILVGCWYHVRRKFIEAEKVSKNAGVASEAIRTIRKLSKIEAKAKKLKPAGVKHLRLKEAKPLLKKFHAWLQDKSTVVLPKSTLGEAVHYALNQWHKLEIYLQDGRLHFDNNHSERAIKPFVIGRKNWLFANTPGGAEAAAIIYSMIETCKAHNMPTYDYLRYVFKHLPTAQTLDELEALLPFNCDKAKIRSEFNQVD